MSVPNVFDLADDELDAEFAERQSQRPRNGISDKDPTRRPFGPPAGGIRGIGQAIKRDVGKVAGAIPKLAERGAQGLLSGFYDEWAGGFVSPDDPKAGAQFFRDRMEQTDEEMPFAGQAAEVAGGIGQMALPMGTGMKGAQIASKIPGFLRGAIGGGVGGAFAGAGMSEGDAADRGMAALTGGALGAAGGAALQGASKVGGAAINALRRDPSRVARTSDKMFGELLESSGKTGDEALGELRRMRGEGADARIADVLGQPGAKRLATIQNISGPQGEVIRETLEARQRDLSDNLADRFVKAAKMGEAPNFREMTDEIVQRRSAQASEAYPKVFAKGTRVDTPAVRAQFAKPEMRAVYQEAQANARLAGDPPLPDLYDEAGELVEAPTVQVIDAVKRLGIDDAIRTANNATGGRASAKGRAWARVKDDLLKAADAADPDYAAVRAEYAGESELLDALETAKNFSTKSANAVKAEVKNLSPGELEMYRARALEDVMENVGKTRGKGDPSLRWDTPQTREKLRVLFPGEEFDQIQSALKDVNKMSKTFGMTQGSRTEPLRADGEEYMIQAGTAAADMARGNVLIPLARMAGNMTGRVTTGATGEVGKKLGQDLMGDDATLEEILKRLPRGGDPQRALTQLAKYGAGTSATFNLFGN